MRPIISWTILIPSIKEDHLAFYPDKFEIAAS